MKELRIPQYLDGRTGDKTLSKAVNRALLLNVLRKGELLLELRLQK